MRKTRSSSTSRDAAPLSARGSGGFDSGALPADGKHTVSQPEPEREDVGRREKPATGITPTGAAGGRRM